MDRTRAKESPVRRLPAVLAMTALGLLVLGMCGLAHAGEVPREPILRLETGMHTSQIVRIGLDTSERLLVTASSDKTIRVWELHSGRLVKVLRVPINAAYDGVLNAVAVSPDGRTLATGGCTGLNWDGSASIYLFDVESGDMFRRLTGLPEVVLHLAFSRDGRYLAATLGKESGLWIYETSAWSLKVKDTQYEAQAKSVDFSGDGRLVTTSLDGLIRLYDREFHLVSKQEARGGSEPVSAVFSPDGQRIAVGFNDSSKVDVLSGRNLSFLYSPDSSGVDNGNLASVAWSSDGSTLYAGGMWQMKDSFQIRAWSQGGKGAFSDFNASDNTIMHIVGLRHGGAVYGAGGPAIGMLQADGNRGLSLTRATADYRANTNGFMISEDGTTARFGLEWWGKRPTLFSVSSRTLSLLSSQIEERSDLSAPVTNNREISVTDWESYCSPKLDGRPLEMARFEISRSLAFAPRAASFVLGTDWYLRHFDRTGRLEWKVSLPSVAWAVNISGNGKLAVAALGDGTIRWYRMVDGNELLALFPHRDGKQWVLWTPSGYYACSAGADELIGWHVNNGKDKSPDYFPASRFRSVYYRPDVTERVLSSLDEKKALDLADEQSGRESHEIAVETMLPPVVAIRSPVNGTEVSTTEVKVSYEVRSPSKEQVNGVRVQVDGRPLSDVRGVLRTDSPFIKPEGGVFETSVLIPERDCEISVIAENRYAASVPATVKVHWVGKSAGPEEFTIKPKLYILSVGIGQYQNPSLQLAYPAKDAKDLAAVFAAQKDKLYRDVVSKVLTDEQASRDGVLAGLEWIERETTSNDVAVVFLSGHGVNDRNGNYCFLPKDADTDSLKRTTISYHEIKATVSRLPGKVLFFVDSCHAGDVMGDRRRGIATDIDKIVNDLVAAENGIVVFASSTGSQYSLENDKWQNGAFTKALVEGLSGKAAYTDKGFITINMLDLYLAERVKELTEGKQTPTTSKPKTIPDFPLAVN